MIEFRQPTSDDADLIKNLLLKSESQSCDYTAGNIIGWNFQYNLSYAVIENCLVLRLGDKNIFGFPKGEKFMSVLEYLMKEYPDCGFFGLEKNECDIIEKLFPSAFSFLPDRASFDYVYKRDELAELKGKKFHSKRNHISFFEKNFNWTYEELTSDNMQECLLMNEKWYEANVSKDPLGIETERKVLNRFFDLYNILDFKGGILRVDGDVVAFTFGERLNSNTFVTHYEKAFSEIRGAYPMINMLFASKTLCEYEFINREDDTGSEGLRKAKMSYCPDYLVEKYTAVRV